MTKFKVGDKVRVTKCLHGHGFNINEIVEIIHHNISIEDYECENSTDSWFLRDTEFELYEEKETEMTAEQIREEILRMDSRIEEAKKDIENAEEERNSLVEKLREKGFEILGENAKYSAGQRVRIVGKQSPRHAESHVGKKGVVEKVDNSDVPYKVILDGSDETSNTWFDSDQVQKI